ncbi:hypothetical protein IWW36_005244, partial [Coemansia brasiliensis]
MSRKRSRSASSPSLSQHSTPSSLTSLWTDEDIFDSPPLKKRSCSPINQEAFPKCFLNSLQSPEYNLYTPTKSLKRKASGKDQFVQRKRHSPETPTLPFSLESSSLRQSAQHNNHAPETPTLSLSLENPPIEEPASSASLLPETPHETPKHPIGKLAEIYRPSGSPTRVTGTKVVTDVNFTDTDSTGVCKVDKSLVCKGFWDSINKAARICLPRRSGKTYNLTQLLLFFSCMPEQEYLLDIPDSTIDASNIAQMDLVAECRLKRERLFDDSLLKKMHPKFYHEHFMKYPVLNISFSKCKGETFGEFVINLCGAMELVARIWIDDYYLKHPEAKSTLPVEIKKLERLFETVERISNEAEDTAAKYKTIALRIFEALSSFISNYYGRYILLVDEYDIPFTTIYLSDWAKKDKKAARSIMKLMYQTMLKDNKNLVKGVLFGVFEVPLTEMGSGANNIKEIRMVPTDEKDIQASVLAA